jgi:general secretion pathway protein H
MQRSSLHRSPQGGMTLIEILIVVGIIASFTVFVVGGISDTAKSNMRRTSGILIRTIKFSYTQAALTSTYYRLAFSLSAEPQTMHVEMSTDPFYIVRADDEAEALRLENEESLSEEDLAEVSSGAQGAGSFQEMENDLFELKELPDNIKIASIQTQEQPEAIEEGDTYLYFFPKGYTQFAVIHLSDIEETNFMTLVVNPLTGVVEVYAEYLEFDDIVEKQNEEQED